MLRSRFITYGPRSELPAPIQQQKKEDDNETMISGSSRELATERRSRYGSSSTLKSPGNLVEPYFPRQMDNTSKGTFITVLDALSTIKVPHSWFTHFYIVSVASSVFWGVQIFIRGPFLRALHSGAEYSTSRNTMSVDQVVVTWALMVVQGVRRLLESFSVAKTSSSNMFVAHWLLGIAFYLAVGISIWIEGIGTLSTHLSNTRIPSRICFRSTWYNQNH